MTSNERQPFSTILPWSKDNRFGDSVPSILFRKSSFHSTQTIAVYQLGTNLQFSTWLPLFFIHWQQFSTWFGHFCTLIRFGDSWRSPIHQIYPQWSLGCFGSERWLRASSAWFKSSLILPACFSLLFYPFWEIMVSALIRGSLIRIDLSDMKARHGTPENSG